MKFDCVSNYIEYQEKSFNLSPPRLDFSLRTPSCTEKEIFLSNKISLL